MIKFLKIIFLCLALSCALVSKEDSKRSAASVADVQFPSKIIIDPESFVSNASQSFKDLYSGERFDSNIPQHVFHQINPERKQFLKKILESGATLYIVDSKNDSKLVASLMAFLSFKGKFTLLSLDSEGKIDLGSERFETDDALLTNDESKIPAGASLRVIDVGQLFSFRSSSFGR